MHASPDAPDAPTGTARPTEGEGAIPGYYLTRRPTMWDDVLRRPRRLPSHQPCP